VRQRRVKAGLVSTFSSSFLRLVADFLDGTGVPHEDCMVSDVDASKPDATKVAETVQALDAKYDPSDVTLYLALAAQQWPSVPEVEAAWRMRG
jgi:hypothetical protein